MPQTKNSNPCLALKSLVFNFAMFTSGDFQVGVNNSCKAVSYLQEYYRMRNALPPNIYDICNNVGKLKSQIEKKINLNSFDNEMPMINDEDATNTMELIFIS